MTRPHTCDGCHTTTLLLQQKGTTLKRIQTTKSSNLIGLKATKYVSKALLWPMKFGEYVSNCWIQTTKFSNFIGHRTSLALRSHSHLKQLHIIMFTLGLMIEGHINIWKFNFGQSIWIKVWCYWEHVGESMGTHWEWMNKYIIHLLPPPNPHPKQT